MEQSPKYVCLEILSVTLTNVPTTRQTSNPVISRPVSTISLQVSKEQQKELKQAFKAKADASGHVHKNLWVEARHSLGYETLPLFMIRVLFHGEL